MGCGASSPAAVTKNIPVAKADTLSEYPEGQEFCFVDGNKEGIIRYAKSGPASEAELPGRTLGDVLKMAAEKHGDKVAMRVERPVPTVVKGEKPPGALPDDEWTTWTYQQYYDDSSKVAKGYMRLGLQQHESVNIFGFNSPEWFMAEVGAILAGGKAAGIYPTDTSEQVAFKSKHSGARVAVVEDKSKLAKFAACIDELPKLSAIVCWAHTPEEKMLTRKDGTEVRVLSWDELLKLGEEVEQAEFQARLDAQKPGHCCALIYTSGTTGTPKAVMISHDNIIFESTMVINILHFLGNEPEPERILSYLPLSHVAGMMVDIICPIVISATKAGWVEVSFARPYDLKLGTIGDRLRAVRPTLFLGVPRVWEKIAEKLQALGASITGLKKKISTWAKAKSLEHQRNCQLGGTGANPPSGLPKKVLLKIKMALGLDQCKFGFTGAAPIQPSTLEYFGSLGIQINEVYGMSECGGATTWSTDAAHLWGSCGWAMPGTEVKVFHVDPNNFNNKSECMKAKDVFNPQDVEEGEICFRGRHIMLGYLANPDLGEEHVALIEKKLAGAIDADGWLHSGDKGCIGKNGMVKITGRYKELIIGAGGENIAPVPIENQMKRECPAISNFVMIGDQRKFNIALVTLKAVGATGEQPGTDELDPAALGVSEGVTTISGACKDEKWAEYIKAGIVATNKTVPNNASKIQRFTILPRDFSVDTAELTPTLKLKRSYVEKQHLAMIEKVYAAGREATYVPYDHSLLPGATVEVVDEEKDEQKE